MKGVLACTFLSTVCLCSPAAHAESHVTYWGSVDARTYGETTYEPIPEIDLRTHTIRSQHSYEILIPDAETGRGIICELIDEKGGILARKFGNTRLGEIRFYFASETPNAKANCVYVNVERLTRPSTGH